MRTFRWCVGLGLLWWGMGAASAQQPCQKLAVKVCKVLGKRAFVCMTYKTIAEHSQVAQSRCRDLLTNDWDGRKTSLKRSESTLRKMDQLGNRSGPAGQKQVRQYKRLWVLCTTARLLKGAPAEPPPCQQLAQMMGAKKGQPPASRMLCQQLALLACRDIGAKSFYCLLFSRIAKSPKIKPNKCQLLVNLWGRSQLAYYQKREQVLQHMTKLAKSSKDPTLAKKLVALRKQEMMRVFMYLHQ